MVVAVSRRIGRSGLIALGCALGALVLLIAAWAIDTGVHSGAAMRNVSLDGVAVGGLSRSDLMTAVTDVEQGEWFNPDFLAQLASGSIPITLAEGEKKTQNIRLGG